MIKNIKRVGIIFLAIAIICLMVIGCLSVNSVASNSGNVTGSNLNNEQNKISADVDNNINLNAKSLAGGFIYNEFELPNYDIDIDIVGSTCEAMATAWVNAVKQAQAQNKVVKFKLMNNWSAVAHTTFLTAFGDDTEGYFEKGCIVIPENCKIVLDLNGKVVNRALAVRQQYGRIFTIKGSLSIIDSSYDLMDVYNIYELNKTAPRDKIMRLFENVKCGKLIGGHNASSFGDNLLTGGVAHVASGGQLDIYSGLYYGNKGMYGAVVGGAKDSVINIYDAIMFDNYSSNDAGCVYSVGICNIYNGLYLGNNANNGIFYTSKDRNYSSNGLMKIYGGILSKNYASGGLLTAYFQGDLKVFNILCEYNYAGQVVINSANQSVAHIFDGIFRYNEGGYILSVDASDSTGDKIFISGGIITENYGGGVFSGKGINMSGGVKIYNNTKNNIMYDIYLRKNEKIIVDGVFTAEARLGIKLASDYVIGEITTGYVASGNTTEVENIFFSNNNSLVPKTTGQEVSFESTINSTNYDYWYLEDGIRKSYKQTNLLHGVNDYEKIKSVNNGNLVLGNILPNTSVNAFVANLGYRGNRIKIYDNNKSNLIYDYNNIQNEYSNLYDNGQDFAVGTGWIVETYTINNKLIETFYISVLGDVTGDGKVNSADVTFFRKMVDNKAIYESFNDKPYLQMSALIVNRAGFVNSDSEILWSVVCGTMNIADFM